MPHPHPHRTQELLVGVTKFKQCSIDLEHLSMEADGVNVVDFGVTNDVTGQVKVEMLDDLEYLVLSRTRTASNGNKPIQRLDRVWDTSK